MAFAPIFQRPFSATFDRRTAAAGNGLLNALVAYWPGNEASGDLLDAHTNALHLTDNNTVTNAAGKVYATARQYTAASNEYHTRNDDAYLSVGDTDFTFAAWCYLDSKHATDDMPILSKFDAGKIEYGGLIYWPTDKRFRIGIANGTTTWIGAQSATAFGEPSTATWYLVVGWHDSAANTVNISVNNSTPESSGTTGVPGDNTSRFVVGAYSHYSAMYKWDGRIGPVAFWKSAAGGGGVLSSSQRSALWNAGNGLAYANFTT